MRYAYWHPTGADDQGRFLVGVKRTGIQIALAVLLQLDTRDLHQIHQGNIVLEAIEFGVWNGGPRRFPPKPGQRHMVALIRFTYNRDTGIS